MRLEPVKLANEPLSYPLGEESRFFYESAAIDFDLAKQQAAQVPNLTILDEEWLGGRGLSPCWKLTFQFDGHVFQIDSNHHAFCASFFVGDRTCPDEVLTRVVDEFATLPSYGPHNQPRQPSLLDREGWQLAIVIGIVVLVVLAMLIRF